MVLQGERGRDGFDGRKGERVSNPKPVKSPGLSKLWIMKTLLNHSRSSELMLLMVRGAWIGTAEHNVIKRKGLPTDPL